MSELIGFDEVIRAVRAAAAANPTKKIPSGECYYVSEKQAFDYNGKELRDWATGHVVMVITGPSCLIGHGLVKAGVKPETILKLSCNGLNVDSLTSYWQDLGVETPNSLQLLWVRKAQQYQDTGNEWQFCITRADQAVIAHSVSADVAESIALPIV